MTTSKNKALERKSFIEACEFDFENEAPHPRGNLSKSPIKKCENSNLDKIKDFSFDSSS